MFRSRTLLAGWVLVVLNAPASAELVTIRFSAEVGFVDDRSNILQTRIRVGDVISGTYTFETTTLDSNSFPTVADYWHHGPTHGISLLAGGLAFRTDPADVEFLVEIVNDHLGPPRDNYLIRSYRNLPLEGCLASVDYITWQLDDPSAAALSSESLPPTPPVLGDWLSQFGLSLEGRRGEAAYFVRAHVTSATIDAGPPAAATAIGVNNVRVAEGDEATFVVFLSGPSSQRVQVDYATAAVSATAGNDYSSVAGTLVFEPGAVTRTVVVPTRGDRIVEPRERFTLQLTNPVNAILGDPQGIARIVDATPTATTVHIALEAQVTEVVDPLGVLAGAIRPGNEMTATYAFDMATGDSNSFPNVGDYWHFGGAHGISISAGGLTFRTDPSMAAFLVEIVNNGSNGKDHYLLRSYSNLSASCRAAVDHISWQLDDTTGAALSGPDLPPHPPVLADWQSDFELNVQGSAVSGEAGYRVRAHVTRARLCRPDARAGLAQCRLLVRSR